jgi:hypothetical protein
VNDFTFNLDFSQLQEIQFATFSKNFPIFSAIANFEESIVKNLFNIIGSPSGATVGFLWKTERYEYARVLEWGSLQRAHTKICPIFDCNNERMLVEECLTDDELIRYDFVDFASPLVNFYIFCTNCTEST